MWDPAAAVVIGVFLSLVVAFLGPLVVFAIKPVNDNLSRAIIGGVGLSFGIVLMMIIALLSQIIALLGQILEALNRLP